jgi:hypothetical protein
MRKVVVLLVGVVLLAAANASAGVSIKLTGGLGYLLSGDYDRSLRGAYDAILASTTDVEGDFKPFRASFRSGLEILVPFGRNIEIGLGGGYESLNVDNRFRYFWLFVTLEDAIESRLTVVPITLNIHTSTRLGRRLGLDLFGGPGYYSLRFRHFQSTGTDFFAFTDTREFESRTGTLGFQGGAALEYALSPGLDLILQADGRLVRLRELKGDLNDSTSWFLGESAARTPDASFWVYDATVGTKSFPLGTFAVAAPAGSEMSNIRSAGLDLSGFGISAGLRLRF